MYQKSFIQDKGLLSPSSYMLGILLAAGIK